MLCELQLKILLNILPRGIPTSCMTTKAKVTSFQRIWLQNASAQFIGCLKREFPLKIHSSPVTCTWKSTHPSLQQLTGLRLMSWIVLTFLFPQKWITAGQTKEKLYFLSALSLKGKYKSSLGSNVLCSDKHHGLPTSYGKSKAQHGARLSTTDVLCHSIYRPWGLLI